MQATDRKPISKKGVKSNAGRPRSEAAHSAILRAAFKLLYKAPARDITTNQIAATAGVSTATLYRWWPTKEAVLLDAFLSKMSAAMPQSTGTPLERLRAHALEVGGILQGKNARVTLRLLMAIQDDEALRKSFFERLYAPHSAWSLECVSKAIEQGQLPRDIDKRLFLDAIFGVLLLRLVIGHAPIDDTVIQQAFDFALAGAGCLKKRGDHSALQR
jgi:AcrR family transcriptional regulator